MSFAWGAWWLDPGVGMLIAAVAVREGIEAWRGQGCCVSSPLEDQDPVPNACSLDAVGERRQRDRYAEIGDAVLAYGRTDTRLVAQLAAGVDAELVEETLAIERECCSFFQLAYDPGTRELSVGVDDAAKAPALDAIAHAMALR